MPVFAGEDGGSGYRPPESLTADTGTAQETEP
jgi:hypothetical protein